MKKIELFLAMDAEAPKNPETFQKSLTTAYVYGVEPLEYVEDTIVDEGNNVVHTIILLKVRERWAGAMKRFLRKAGFEYMTSRDGLKVYA